MVPEVPGGESATDADPLLTRPRKARLLDARFEPLVMTRFSYIHTFDSVTEFDNNGDKISIDSSRADPSPFGHRVGFILENVELGFEGRFNDFGLYYKTKFELVPREKDGNRNSDFLRDAYIGWDMFKVFDVRVGRMKLPFSQANLKHTGDRPVAFSPTLDTFIPRRRLGLRVDGGDPWQVTRLYFGVYNSVNLAFEQIKDLDQLLLVGRFELRVHNLLRELGSGFVDTLPFRLRLAGNVAWVKQRFDPETEHRWVGADLHLTAWRFQIEAEFMFKDFFNPPLPDGLLKANRGWGWYVDLTFQVIPTWFDVTVRVEQSDGDDEVRGFSPSLSTDDTSRQKKRWITVGLTAHLFDYGKVMLNYILRDELEGYNVFNDVLLVMFQGDL